MKAEVFSDQIPTCTECAGVVKPCIVFFGEPLPVRFKDLYETDLGTCDLLIVMGTSLKVAPFAGLVYRVPQTTPRLLVRNPPLQHTQVNLCWRGLHHQRAREVLNCKVLIINTHSTVCVCD